MLRHKENDFYENLAMISLQDLYPNKFSRNMRMSDKPDLQDTENGIGVEVTRVLFSHEAEVNRYSRELEMQTSQVLPPKIASESGKNKYSTVLYYTLPVRGNGYPVFMPSLEPLMKAFMAKLKKLNSGGYTIFKENNLYLIITPYDTYTSQKIDEFMLLAGEKQANHALLYDHIFINEYGKFFDCNMQKGNKETFVLTHDQMHQYNIKARAYFNSSL